MATINDYVLELGWDGRQVEAGLDRLEQRMKRLSAMATRLNKQGYGVRPPAARQTRKPSETYSEEKRLRLEKERLAIINAITVKEYKLKAMRDSVSTRTSRGRALAQELDEAIAKTRRFGNEVRNTSVRSQRAMVGLRVRQGEFNTSLAISSNRIKKLAREMGVLERVGRRAAASFTSFAAAGLGAYAIMNLGQAAYRAAKDFESMDVSMQAAFGSQEQAIEQMNYVRGVAKKYALDINAAGDGWAKIALSAKASNMPTSDAQEIFENTAMAARAFNLSADDTKGTFRALIQMMGKGKVNAEDMRQQLAERIPAAMPILAKSMGVTYGEMEEMMARGEIGAEALVGWSQEMAKLVKDSGAYEKSLLTMSAGQTLFVNALKESARILFSGKLDYSLGTLMRTMQTFLVSNEANIGFFGDMLGKVADGANYLIETFSPLFSMIVTGYRLIWQEWEKLGEMTLFDAHQKGGLTLFFKIIRGLIIDVQNGWKMLIDSIVNFSIADKMKEFSLISDWWGQRAKGRRDFLAGNDYMDSSGVVNKGWRSKAMTEGQRLYQQGYQRIAAGASDFTQGAAGLAKQVKIEINGADMTREELVSVVSEAVDGKLEASTANTGE